MREKWERQLRRRRVGSTLVDVKFSWLKSGCISAAESGHVALVARQLFKILPCLPSYYFTGNGHSEQGGERLTLV